MKNRDAVRKHRKEFSDGLPFLRFYTAPGHFHTCIRFNKLYDTEVAGVRLWIGFATLPTERS